MAHPLSAGTDIQPYTALLYDALRSNGVLVEEYRTAALARNPPDVVHLHWPEHVLQRSGVRRVARAAVLLGSLSLAKARGTVVAYTAHNTRPHDLVDDRFSRWFLDAFDRRVDVVLLMTLAAASTVWAERPALKGAIVAHTRHGHFRGAYPPALPAAEARDRIGIPPSRPTVVFAGQVRAYKGVLDVLSATENLDVEVLVAGWCSDDGLQASLETAAARRPSVHLDLRKLTAAEMVETVSAASVVALPYRRVLNSGSAMLALSLGRPVLVPDLPTFRELRDEVGAGWVHLYQGEHLAERDLEAALAATPSGGPDLGRHEWDLVAKATAEAYTSAVGRGGAPPLACLAQENGA